MIKLIATLLCITICLNQVISQNIATTRRLHRRDTTGCQLPSHPPNGYFSIFGSTSNISVGEIVQEGTIVKVKCHKNFQLKGSNITFCETGKWSHAIGQCLKLCQPIYESTSYSVTCKLNNVALLHCREPLDGTIAHFKCDNYYENTLLGNLPPLICIDGKWSDNLPTCRPVCGRKSTTPLIIGGNNVIPGNFPWTVAIYNLITKQLICGGSLITQRMILTAAHCVTDHYGNLHPTDWYRVAVGKYYNKIDDTRDINSSQFSSVKYIFVPDEYEADLQNFLADISIIVTEKLFQLTENVQPICLDWLQQYEHTLMQSINGYVSGWGLTAENGQPSDTLKQLKIPTVSNSQCRKNLPEGFRRYLTSDKFCAGKLNLSASVCLGDSGGGLVFEYEERYYIMGIVSNSPRASTAEGGCDSQQYALYTKISSYINFVARKQAEIKNDFSAFHRTPGDISRTKCREYSKYAKTNNAGAQTVECGNKIKYGMLTGRNEFPHMVVFGFEHALGGVEMECDGVLISDQFVLTAARCLVLRYAKFLKYARLGVTNLNDNSTHKQQILISEKILHPLYRKQSKYHDIGLVKLEKPVEINSFVRPACLYPDREIRVKKAIATGWGATSFEGDRSNELLKVSLNLLDHSACNNTFTHLGRELEHGIIDDIHFCAGTELDEKGSCAGDSGGPLQVFHAGDAISCLYDIIGVESFAKTDCGTPGVYTRVSNYIKWIEDVVWP